MNCTSFESEIVALLDDPLDEPERRARAGALLRHAAGCPSCGDVRELVELLIAPPEARDPIAEPDGTYWASFHERLEGRIRAEHRSRTRRRLAAVASVAAAALVVLGAWLLGPRDAEVEVVVARGGAERPGERPRPAPLATPSEDPAGPSEPGGEVPLLPADLPEQWLASADPDALLVMDVLPGADDAWLWESVERGEEVDDEPAGLFPEIDLLDGEGRRALLEWIREQERRLEGGKA